MTGVESTEPPEAGAEPVAAVTGTGGRELKKRGLATRRRLLDAAERIFGEIGFYDASIVKITEAAGVAQGTFYLYFSSKQEIFEELVRDLNARVRHAMQESAAQGRDRIEAERLGFRGYFRRACDDRVCAFQLAQRVTSRTPSHNSKSSQRSAQASNTRAVASHACSSSSTVNSWRATMLPCCSRYSW